MKDFKDNGDGIIDQKYEESTDVAGGRKKDMFSWGFFALVGCVLFALYEIIRSVIYFF